MLPLVSAIIMACAPVRAPAQDTLRIASYNLLNYPGSDGAARHPFYRTVLRMMNPDVLAVQEMGSSAGVTQFRDAVLNAVSPSPYSSAPFDDGPDSDNALFYRADRVAFLGATYIANSPRRIAEYRILPVGTMDTIRLYSLHFKANIEDSLLRYAEAITLRNHLNNLPSGSKFIVAGDFNIYRSTEPAFLKLTGSEADNDGRCLDPLNAVGTWNNNFAFRAIHTQSTRVRAFGDGSTGGLDDRFDMLLLSAAMDPLLVSSSYRAYGNDGGHFNDSINEPPNTAVADSVADGLHYASDHLPVFADFRVGTSGPDTGFTSIASGAWSSPGIWSGGAVPSSGSDVTIAPGTSVTLAADGTCRTIHIGGVLQFDATDGTGMTVQGDLTVAPGGELRPSTAFTSGSATHTVTLGGSALMHGTFTARLSGSTSGTRVINVVFNGTDPAVIGGSAASATFNILRMEMAGTGVTLTPLLPLGFAAPTANALTLVRGTWVQSGAATTTPSVNITVDSAAVLAISDAGTFGTGSASLLVRGVLDVSGGAVTVGAGNNRLEVLAGGMFILTGGAVSVNGRCTFTGGATTMDGGTIVVDPRGTTPLSSSSNVVEMAAAAAMTMTGGTITIRNPRTATGTGRELRILAGAGTKSLTGGAFVFGQGASTATGSDSGFVIVAETPLPSVLLRTGGGTGRTISLASNLTTSGLMLESGDLHLGEPFTPGFDLVVNGNLRRVSGRIVHGGRLLTLAPPSGGGADTIGAGFTGAAACDRLTLSASGVLEGDLEIRETLELTGGTLRTGGFTVVLDSPAVLQEVPGGTIVGRVQTARTVQQGIPETFGGIGLELTAADAAPGLTGVERITGEPVTREFTSSIGRVFRVSPALNGGLNASLRFRYDETELLGQDERTLSLWGSADSGATWSATVTSPDTALNTLDAGGVDTLLWVTAADSANPLRLLRVTMNLREGWTMVSVPVLTPRDSVLQLFPAASTGSAFSFTPAGYQVQQRLLPGIGYWVKHPADTTADITGFAVEADTIPVAAGWNLVGAISVPLDTGSVTTDPAGIRRSGFIGFDGLYAPVDSLRPGRAHWVKFAEPGMLLLGEPARRVRK